MTNTLERSKLLFEADGFRARTNGEELEMFSRAGSHGIHIHLYEPDGGLLKVMIQLLLFCPEYRRAAIYEAIGRANFGLSSGAFEMDSFDGEIRFRNCMSVQREPSDEDIRWLVMSAWSTVSQYADALLQVIATEVEPEVAIARAEEG